MNNKKPYKIRGRLRSFLRVCLGIVVGYAAVILIVLLTHSFWSFPAAMLVLLLGGLVWVQRRRERKRRQSL